MVASSGCKKLVTARSFMSDFAKEEFFVENATNEYRAEQGRDSMILGKVERACEVQRCSPEPQTRRIAEDPEADRRNDGRVGPFQ